jgi:hypothetical protein
MPSRLRRIDWRIDFGAEESSTECVGFQQAMNLHFSAKPGMLVKYQVTSFASVQSGNKNLR